jgi:hypothetical protein
MRENSMQTRGGGRDLPGATPAKTEAGFRSNDPWLIAFLIFRT